MVISVPMVIVDNLDLVQTLIELSRISMYPYLTQIVPDNTRYPRDRESLGLINLRKVI